MKKLTIFETGIIGFLTGSIIAAYLSFVVSNERSLGHLLKWISLRPVFESLHLPFSDGQTLVAGFVFCVIVFTLYGVIIGAIVSKAKSSKALLAVIALLVIAGGYEQFTVKNPVISHDTTNFAAAAFAIPSKPKIPQQYFGNEATGDLNSDGSDDVAFIIHRNDKERGTLYYLSSALTTTNGRAGTNLIFLGDKANPQGITIHDDQIDILISYGNSTTTETFSAKVTDGNLEKIEATSTASI